jgi:hypothetical protein
MDVRLEVMILHRQLIVLALDDVADGDEADDQSLFEHRQVTDAMLGHEAHRVFHGIAGRAGDDVGGHHMSDANFIQRTQVRGARAKDIAFGNDAEHATLIATIGFAHHERTAIVLHELLDYVLKHRFGSDGVYRKTFLTQNLLQSHGNLSSTDVTSKTWRLLSLLLAAAFAAISAYRNCKREVKKEVFALALEFSSINIIEGANENASAVDSDDQSQETHSEVVRNRPA